MLVDGVARDYHAAKLKALKHLGLSDTIELPSNAEVEAELKLCQTTFDSNTHEQLIRSRRIKALESMRMFEEYSPRLFGAVFEGTATRYSPLEIQVFPDSPKDVVIKLLDFDVPFDTEDRRIRISKNESQVVPVYCFGVDDVEVELSVLQPNSLRQSPLSSITNSPMKRASIKQLIKMIEGSSDSN